MDLLTHNTIFQILFEEKKERLKYSKRYSDEDIVTKANNYAKKYTAQRLNKIINEKTNNSTV